MTSYAGGFWLFIMVAFISHLSTFASSDFGNLPRARRQSEVKALHQYNTRSHYRGKKSPRNNLRSISSKKDENLGPKTSPKMKQAYPLIHSHQTGSNSILQVSSACGSAKPTRAITTTSGPNGHESFLNCGITGGGWVPPNVTMFMIESCSLDHEPAKSTFAACKKFRPLFEKHGRRFGIPPIFLAAFAMQESSCQPNVTGDQGGAFGLMQITKDKCSNAPGGDCAEPDYNVKMGAQTFADGLAAAQGNVLAAVGGYNGWVPGLTKQQAMEARKKGCCVCQQNLDYLHQFFNGWLQGIDPGVHKLGTMRNLDVCGPDAKR